MAIELEVHKSQTNSKLCASCEKEEILAMKLGNM